MFQACDSCARCLRILGSRRKKRGTICRIKIYISLEPVAVRTTVNSSAISTIFVIPLKPEKIVLLRIKSETRQVNRRFETIERYFRSNWMELFDCFRQRIIFGVIGNLRRREGVNNDALETEGGAR